MRTAVGEVRGTVLQSTVSGLHTATLVDTFYNPVSPTGTGIIYAMDYNLEQEILYFVDRNSSTLWNVSLYRLTSSRDDRALMLEGVNAWEMAYDWINGYLYWTDDM